MSKAQAKKYNLGFASGGGDRGDDAREAYGEASALITETYQPETKYEVTVPIANDEKTTWETVGFVGGGEASLKENDADGNNLDDLFDLGIDDFNSAPDANNSWANDNNAGSPITAMMKRARTVTTPDGEDLGQAIEECADDALSGFALAAQAAKQKILQIANRVVDAAQTAFKRKAMKPVVHVRGNSIGAVTVSSGRRLHALRSIMGPLTHTSPPEPTRSGPLPTFESID